MGDCTLDKDSYKQVIADDIKLVEQHIPDTFMLKTHILAVLEWSIDQAYPPKHIPPLPSPPPPRLIKEGCPVKPPPVTKPAYTCCSELLPDGFVFSASGRVILDPKKYPEED